MFTRLGTGSRAKMVERVHAAARATIGNSSDTGFIPGTARFIQRMSHPMNTSPSPTSCPTIVVLVEAEKSKRPVRDIHFPASRIRHQSPVRTEYRKANTEVKADRDVIPHEPVRLTAVLPKR